MALVPMMVQATAQYCRGPKLGYLPVSTQPAQHIPVATETQPQERELFLLLESQPRNRPGLQAGGAGAFYSVPNNEVFSEHEDGIEQ